MRGSKTDLDKVEEFRALYLQNGNVAKSAKKVGIPATTGYDWANKFAVDPTFVEARRVQRARALDEAERAVMGVIDVAEKRFCGKGPKIPEGAENITVVDKRPDYGKLIVDAHRSIASRARLDAEKSGEVASHGDVTITVKGPDGQTA